MHDIIYQPTQVKHIYCQTLLQFMYLRGL